MSEGGGHVLDAPEVERHLELVATALDAPDTVTRDDALGRAFVQFGPRFLASVAQLQAMAEERGSNDPRWAALFDAAIDRLGAWLGGEQLTERADEPARRARSALDLMEQFAGHYLLVRPVAKAILDLPEDHPLRDVARVRAYAEGCLAQPDGEGRPESKLDALGVLVGHYAAAEELDALEARARALFEQVEPQSVEQFRLAVTGRCMVGAIGCRDEGDEDGRQAWVQRARPHLDHLAAAERPGTILVAALAADQADEYATAARLYDVARAHAEASPTTIRLATLNGGRARFTSGDAAGAVELLLPMLPGLARAYAEAVDPAVADDAGVELARSGEHLTLALIALGRWDEALHVLDRLKSCRFRFRQALRASAGGRALLGLERLLLDAQRGIPVELPPRPDDPGDRLAAGIPTLATLLEDYRVERPPIDPDLVQSPGVGDLAAALGEDEAALVLGITYDGTVLAVVTPDCGDAPAAATLVREHDKVDWMEVLLGEKDDGWAFVLGAPEAPIDRPAALRSIVEAADARLGRTAVELMGGAVPKRLVVVPHGFLHLVPFQALPSFADAVVVTAPSAAQFVHDRRRPAPALEGTVAAVVDPTLDLPLSPGEASSVRRFAEQVGLPYAELHGRKATEAAVIEAARGAGLVHLSGHGQCDVVAPDNSALLLAPPAEIDGDPFPAWLEAAESWSAVDEETRRAVVPGVGVLTERTLLDGAWVDRTMDLPDRCTVWSHRRDGRLLSVAERWSAGDLFVDDALDGCALIVLSACEAAVGALNAEVDEHSGLPAALAVGGAGTVVATQWPVDEGVAAVAVELLYRALAARRGEVDVAEVVAEVRRALRGLGRDEAADLVDGLRSSVADPACRIRLEALARRLRNGPPVPFADPWHWAAFVVAGPGRIVVKEGG